jgi:ComF family protein
VRFIVGALSSAVNNILHLFFPEYCKQCHLELLSSERFLCVFCTTELYETYGVAELPKRLSPYPSASAFYYQKGNVSQKILFAMKYENNFQLCRYWGSKIQTAQLALPTLLIPVPLHPNKKYKRGYNQSEWIAKGIIDSHPNLIIRQNIVRRIHNTDSQTTKQKAERNVNVKNAFKINVKNLGNHSHVGLVDDVVTTGATLFEMIRLLKEVRPELRITIFVVGIAN